MKKWICVVIAILLLSGCGLSNWGREANIDGNQKPALKAIDHLNQKVKMDILDEIPNMGIVVIRFIDAGHTRYIAVLKDQVSVLSHTEIGGKNPVYNDTSIQTLKTGK